MYKLLSTNIINYRSMSRVLCMPLSMLWMAYTKHRWFQTTTTTSTGVRPMSAKTNNTFSIRSAALMDNNNSAGDNINGYDMIQMKNRCIRSIGYIIRAPLEYDSRIEGGIGSGVFVANRLLLTCYHVVRQSPVIGVVYVYTYDNNQLLKTLIMMAEVLYVEPQWDLALVRLHEWPSPAYNTATSMQLATTTNDDDNIHIDFGEPVATIGHGQDLQYGLHPAHNTVNIYGFSGCPLIDTDGRMCGMVWGGISHRGLVTYALDSITIKEFVIRGLIYERDGIKLNRLRKRYEWHIQEPDTRLLGLILDTKPFSSSFTVQSVLPTVSDETKRIIGSRVTKVFGQVFNNIDVIRSAIGTNRVIKLSIGLPTININTIAPVDNQGFKPHWDLAVVRLYEWPSPAYNTANSMLLATNASHIESIGVLCMPLSMLWMAYNKQPLFHGWQSFQTITTTPTCVRPMSANKYNTFSIRSAALMANNNNTGADNINGFDMIAMKNRCIRSIGYIIRPLLEDPDTDGGTGSGVFVANRLLLTCYHVVKQSPFIWVVYVRSYDNQVMINLIMGAEVLYVEPHWDLALVQLHQWPSPIYNTAKSMLLATSGNQIIDFGEPVATIGHGQDLRYGLHPGMITTPRVDSYLIPVSYYISLVPFNEKMPIITHNTVNIYGFSGCPLIDTEGRMCGMVWGGISKRGLVSYALDSITIKEFVVRGLTYQRDGIKQNRLRERYEWDIREPDTRLLGLILSKQQQQPFSGSFTVQSVLPTVSGDTKRIIGSRVTKVFGQEFNNIAVIRSAIGSNRVIKLSIELPTDDDSSSSSSSDSQWMTVRDVNINTIAPVDNQGFSIKPLVI
ncbi:uncharacterized protein LOC128954996 [Oppia nitens]|uniref:uncharacterized protein LOC128954996 n=1 Tax=Oppia nitens TaxID=1686743 RepID=UPI0023DC5FAB|nr:uncharacterized protein LOC128954996 [Oppia nitens]